MLQTWGEQEGESDVEETGQGNDGVELAIESAWEHPVHAERGAEADEEGQEREDPQRGDGGFKAWSEENANQERSGDPDDEAEYGTDTGQENNAEAAEAERIGFGVMQSPVQLREETL